MKYYNPHSEEEHMPVVVGHDRDETGLVRAITVKVNFVIPQSIYLIPLFHAGAVIITKKTTFQGHSNTRWGHNTQAAHLGHED